MTMVLMLENLIRMILQTIYNTVSFLLQLLSLLPICIIILVTARMKCFMCGGGGGCPNRGGSGGCDCLMTFVAMALLLFIFRATGILDKIFFKLGYAKAPQIRPTGGVTQCSRNDTEYYDDDSDKAKTEKSARKFRMRVSKEEPTRAAKEMDMYEQTTEELYSEFVTDDPSSTPLLADSSDFVTDTSEETIDDNDDAASMLTTVELSTPLTVINKVKKKEKKGNLTIYVDLSIEPRTTEGRARIRLKASESSKKGSEMTTVLYYLVA